MKQIRLGLDLEIPESLGYWIAGFVTGEGYFTAIERCPKDGQYPYPEIVFGINLRRDDAAVLLEIQQALGGIGSFYCYEGHWPSPSRDYRSKPFARWTVKDLGQCYHVIVPLFELYPLKGRKALEFNTWKKAVEFVYHKRSLKRGKSWSKEFWKTYRGLVKQFKQTREYIEPKELIEASGGRERQ